MNEFSRFTDLMSSCRELDSWTQDLVLPAVVWLSGLFNPQSFLTGEVSVSVFQWRVHQMYLHADCFFFYLFPAVLQSIARKNQRPLDKMTLTVDVTKKTKDDFGHPPREGTYIYGLFMEGQNECTICPMHPATLNEVT